MIKLKNSKTRDANYLSRQMSVRIYADHAATTKLDNNALNAMMPYLVEEYGNASQVYSFARPIRKALQNARERIASQIGALPEEIFFTSGGSESDNWAIKGTTIFEQSKSSIITSEIEHHAVLASCEMCRKMGADVRSVPVTKEGLVDSEIMKSIISDQTNLVSVMMANNEIGSIQPIRKLTQIAHAHGAIMHTDAVQAVGHIPVFVNELGIDLLSASAHKFNGPKGIGFLYVRRGTKLSPYINGGNQESRLRAGTENIAAIVGMAEALDISCCEMENRSKHLLGLETLLLDSLNEYRLDYIRNGSSNHIPGNISISFKNASGEMLLHRLDLMGIYVSTGSACNSEVTELSHVIKAIRVPPEYAHGTIRISLGYENTVEEVKTIAKAIKRIIG